MARLTDTDRKQKMQKAKILFFKNHPLPFIATTIGVKMETLTSWINKEDWDKNRKTQNVTPGEIQQLILDTFYHIKQGKQPPYSPDQLAKLASAYEKLTDKKKHEGYYLDAYTALLNHVIAKALKIKNKKNTQRLNAFVNELAEYTNEVIKELFTL